MKKKEKIQVIEIVGTDSYLIKSSRWNTYGKVYLLNGHVVSEMMMKSDFTISKDDKLQSLSKSKVLICYKRGDETMDVDTFESMPTYYDCGSTEEETLRAIANKKELQGFEPVLQDPKPEDIEFDIVGFVKNTGSKFITCRLTGRFSNDHVLYDVNGSAIAMDEYNILSRKYSEHARFEKSNRTYLRFVQINNKYAFGEVKPFSDRDYFSSFENLDEAQKEERWIRDAVKARVEKCVFSESITETKKLQILDNLTSIRKLKTLKSKDEMTDILIKDINEYLKYC